MASSNRGNKECAGCRQLITDRYIFLTCCLCNQAYDLECANVSQQRFMNTMTTEHKSRWRCPLCLSKVAKTNNSNTPVRQSFDGVGFVDTRNMSRQQRRKAISPVRDDDSIVSYLGETLHEENEAKQHLEDNSPNKSPTQNHTLITLDQISNIIQENLVQNNKSILLAIQDTIQKEIAKSLKDLKTEFIQNIEKIQTRQTDMEEKIMDIEEKIKQIENEKHKLNEEYKNIQKSFQEISFSSKPSLSLSPNSHENIEKYIVLHGLNPVYNETEDELIDRVAYVFHEILNINIIQYIDEITLIGRQGKGPLKIEITNKRARKYILQNYTYFRENGLAVTEFLNESALRERRELKKAMISARKNGQHAIIRNNKLIINGKESVDCLIDGEKNTNSPNPPTKNQDNPTNYTSRNTNPNKDLNKSNNLNMKKNHSFRK